MSKRFTDSEKWKDEWFCDLKPVFKLLWIYLMDQCDFAGIWKVNRKLAEFQIGEKIDWEEAIKIFNGRILQKDDYWCVIKFLTFQYGPKLNKGDAVRGASEILENKGFKEDLERVLRLSIHPQGRVKAKAMAKANSSLEEGGLGEEKKVELEPKELTPIQKVVTAWKITSGYEKNDKAWDVAHFSRCTKSAKTLIDFLGSWESAVYCIEDTYRKLNSKGLTTTLETIVKHSADWKKDNQEKEFKYAVLR